MKDFRGRAVVIGNSVIYAASGGLVVATVTGFEDGKATLTKEDGKVSTITWKDEKAVLVRDVATLA